MSHEPIRTDKTGGLGSYAQSLADLVRDVEVTSRDRKRMDASGAVARLAELARSVHARGNKLIFVGNGGSAAIASHMATDCSKNGNVRSLALNDASMLTCLGNDLGYERVFAMQIEWHARAGDLVFAISSSGRSPNILKAVEAALASGCTVVTLSGFESDNPLRLTGDYNFHIASDRYGFVEVGHLTICHAIVDLICGFPLSAR